jgi:hypothetical protein
MLSNLGIGEEHHFYIISVRGKISCSLAQAFWKSDLIMD